MEFPNGALPSNETKGTVLIVDDQMNNLILLNGMLSAHGYNVRPAINGKLAIASMKLNPPDLVLLDIRMPEINGYEVCSRMKADEETQNIPVIFISALNDVADKIQGFKVGAVDYISKPFHVKEVLARVNTHMTIRKLQVQLEAQNKKLIEAAQFQKEVENITRHDLKGPLTPIISFPGVIGKHANLTPKDREYLETIKQAGLRILDIVNRSLDIFKIEQGTYRFEPALVNVLKIIENINNEFQDILIKKGLAIAVLLDDNTVGSEDSFIIQGEKLLSYSMLSNLVRNAVEASSKGETITIHLKQCAEARLIYIHNKAVVAPHIVSNFFDKYITSGKLKGTGLGTYSAKLSAEIQGGHIEMESTEDKGTTITIRFPKPQADS